MGSIKKRVDYQEVIVIGKVIREMENGFPMTTWLKEVRLTHHHLSATKIQLIPTDLHGNIPHIELSSDLRGGK